jgi:hypothetical protein
MGEDGQLEPSAPAEPSVLDQCGISHRGYPWKRLFRCRRKQTNALVFMGKFLDWMDPTRTTREVEFEQGDATGRMAT